MFRFLLILSMVFFINLLNAGVKEDFFQAGLGAKSNALGGTAFAFGVDSLFSNPAGLAVLPEEYFSYSYKNNYESLVNSMVLGYTSPWRRGAWGVGAITMSNGNAEQTEVDEFDRPTVVGTFGEEQKGFCAAFSYPFGDKAAYGLGVRYYQNDFLDEQAKSLGLYAGVIKKFGRKVLLGLSFNNFSLSGSGRSEINWSTGQVDQFPLRYSFSGAYLTTFFEKQTELFADIHYVEVNEAKELDQLYSLGAIYWFVPKIFNARLGRQDEVVSSGFGFRFFDIAVDYAFLMHDYLGNSHLLSISMHFNTPKEELAIN